jgi:RNA polymerase-binding protein DksA
MSLDKSRLNCVGVLQEGIMRMSRSNVDKVRERLLADKARLEHDREVLKSADGISGSVGDSADLDINHPADSGTETFERTKDLALRANVGGMLSQIDDALAKIDAGTYGVCDRCGQAIAPARLEALPYATLCVSCQDRVETTQ